MGVGVATKRRDFVEAQLCALGATRFELGVFDPEAVRRGVAVGAMLLSERSKEELLLATSWLAFRNAAGHHIYVRPKAPHGLSLIDDLSRDAVARLAPEGFSPSVVVETSPGNFQAWVDHGRVLEPRLSTFVSRELARRFGGDFGSADFRHFGRLAGFTNRKPKHRRQDGSYPYVRLHVAQQRVYAAATAFVANAESLLAAADAAEAARRASFIARQPVNRPGRAIESFWEDPKYGGDLTRADLAFATSAIARGLSFDEIEAAISTRDLSHKGSPARQRDYIARTLRKAEQSARPTENR